ncbi:MAG: hypothetical protein WC634_01215 [archaeon]
MREKNCFNKAMEWILDSGIQESNGAISAWHDLGSGKNSFEYSEITGYGITTLVFLNSLKKSPGLFEKVEKAEGWLGSRAITKEGAVLARSYRPWEQADKEFSFEGGNCFAFDAGMVLNGLVNKYNAKKNPETLRMTVKVGNFLAGKMMEGGKMCAVYSAKTGKVLDEGNKWSNQPGSYHAKVAIGLFGLFKITGEEKFEKAAKELCEFALKKQLPEGNFETNSFDKSTHMHPHCYSAEGLLFAGKFLREERFVNAAEKATAWAMANQQENGGINAFFCGKWNQSQRSDVLAQVLRLASALKAMGRLENVSKESLSRLRNRLMEFQHESGGFLYGNELDLAEKNCTNAWCTMFALQALQWHEAKRIDFETLI